MKISEKDLAHLLIALSAKPRSRAEISNLWQKLNSQGVLGKLPRICRQAEDLLHEQNNQISVRVTSEEILSAEQIKTISLEMQRRFNKEVIIENVVNKNIYGGLIVEAGDLIIDASIKNQLAGVVKQIGQ